MVFPYARYKEEDLLTIRNNCRCLLPNYLTVGLLQLAINIYFMKENLLRLSTLLNASI